MKRPNDQSGEDHLQRDQVGVDEERDPALRRHIGAIDHFLGLHPHLALAMVDLRRAAEESAISIAAVLQRVAVIARVIERADIDRGADPTVAATTRARGLVQRTTPDRRVACPAVPVAQHPDSVLDHWRVTL